MSEPSAAGAELQLDPAGRTITLSGRRVRLAPRAFDLLAALAAESGRIVSRDDLIRRVWPGVVVEDNNLAVQVTTLRKVLGAGAIETIPGRGYRYVPVEARPPELPSALAAADDDGPQPLFGRDADLDLLDDLLRQERLVTLTGSAGIGKSRLAAALVARRGLAPGGAARAPWIDLGSISIDRDFPAALEAAGLAGEDGLVVLDNAEVHAATVAAVLEPWLAGDPARRALVTSQVPLRLGRERVLRVGGLGAPSASAPGAVAVAHPAVAFFAWSAAAADSAFELSAGNVEAVAAVCRLLEGHPLWLQLAAGRVRHFGIASLASVLSDQPWLMHGGHRHTPPRQRSVIAGLRRGQALLDDVAARVFRQLAGVECDHAPDGAGDFSLDAALAACERGGTLPDAEPLRTDDVLDALVELVDRSFLAVADTGAGRRYRLGWILRAFALEPSRTTGEDGSVP